nr:unnamed protein product [Spirometra erinaceieuropaei]
MASRGATDEIPSRRHRGVDPSVRPASGDETPCAEIHTRQANRTFVQLRPKQADRTSPCILLQSPYLPHFVVMPWFPEHDRIHLLLILVWVPLQMLALQYIRGSDVPVGSGLTAYLPSLPSPMDLSMRLGQLTSWARQRANMLFSSFRKRPLQQFSTTQKDPQEIVELHERDYVFFGASQTVRKKHPPKVRFRVGDSVQHRKLGYQGVVVGWDEVACAPAIWMAMRYPDLKDEMRVRDQPNYRVLFDSRATTYELNPIYVAQEDLKAASSADTSGGKKARSPDDDTLPIKHSLLPEYFDYFESDKFIPRPWLRRIYPRG